MARKLKYELPSTIVLEGFDAGDVAADFKRHGGALAMGPVNIGATGTARVSLPAGHDIQDGDDFSVEVTPTGGAAAVTVSSGPIVFLAPALTPAAPAAGPTAPPPVGPIGPPIPPAAPMGMPTWKIALITLGLAALVLGVTTGLIWGLPLLAKAAPPADSMPSWTAFGGHTAAMTGLLPSMSREHQADLEAKKAAERKAATAADEARLARETAERRPADMAASLEGLGASVKTTFGIGSPPPAPLAPPAPPAPPAIVLGPGIVNPICSIEGCTKTDLDKATHGH